MTLQLAHLRGGPIYPFNNIMPACRHQDLWKPITEGCLSSTLEKSTTRNRSASPSAASRRDDFAQRYCTAYSLRQPLIQSTS